MNFKNCPSLGQRKPITSPANYLNSNPKVVYQSEETYLTAQAAVLKGCAFSRQGGEPINYYEFFCKFKFDNIIGLDKSSY